MLTPEQQQRLDQVVDVAEYQLKTMAESRALLKNILEIITAAGGTSPIRAEDLVGAVEDEAEVVVRGVGVLTYNPIPAPRGGEGADRASANAVLRI